MRLKATFISIFYKHAENIAANNIWTPVPSSSVYLDSILNRYSVFKGAIKGLVVSTGEKFSKPLAIQCDVNFSIFSTTHLEPHYDMMNAPIQTVMWCVSSTTQYSPWGTAVVEEWSRDGRLPMQETWEIKSAQSTQHFPLSLLPDINFLLSVFLSILSPHLAAFQSLLLNIQCFCTLSSCLSKWHNPWRKKKN